jgi:mannose PTS system EIIA component
MLWRTLCYSGEALESLVGRALAGAAQGAMQLGNARPQNQAPGVESHDQTNAQHQQ